MVLFLDVSRIRKWSGVVLWQPIANSQLMPSLSIAFAGAYPRFSHELTTAWVFGIAISFKSHAHSIWRQILQASQKGIAHELRGIRWSPHPPKPRICRPPHCRTPKFAVLESSTEHPQPWACSCGKVCKELHSQATCLWSRLNHMHHLLPLINWFWDGFLLYSCFTREDLRKCCSLLIFRYCL